MSVNKEFSKYAHKYQQLNQIQAEVARKLITSLTRTGHPACKPKKILDLGCGSGAIYNLIDWEIEKFVGVDFSSNMLSLHPKAQNVTCKLGDFNDTKLFEELREEQFDYIISASALQWADNVQRVFSDIAKFDLPFSLAIFSAGTFATLNKTAGLSSIIPSYEILKEFAQNALHVDVSIEKLSYSLEFENTREMLRYIKRSGVSGGRNLLTYKQTKKLMDEYPLRYLEFEVVYINSFSKA
ncbi:MAG: methyltransferase domain-containing protein [Thiovulaceae bacterium]|nr:methyltransferase domain-containing protein [Sulfurimonadaceae bacterium]